MEYDQVFLVHTAASVQARQGNVSCSVTMDKLTKKKFFIIIKQELFANPPGSPNCL